MLQYLDMEHSWINTLEEKVKATENLPESTEAISEALEVQIPTHTHVYTFYESYILYSTFFSSLLLILLKAVLLKLQH